MTYIESANLQLTNRWNNGTLLAPIGEAEPSTGADLKEYFSYEYVPVQ